MAEPTAQEKLERLQIEVETLRLANAAILERISRDTAQTESILRALEDQAAALGEANRRQTAQADFTRRVMDTSSALMIVLGPEGRIRQVNRSFTTDLGAGEGDVIGRVLDDWLPPEERADLARTLPDLPWPVHSPLFEQVRICGVYAAEHRLVGADGSARCHWLEASLQHDPRGKEEGAVISATDISGLKQQQDALRRSERQLREAQRIAQLGHWDLDLASGRFDVSEEVGRILERRPPPLDAAEFLDLVHPDDVAEVRTALDAIAVQTNRVDLNFRLSLPDGRIKWIQTRGVTQRDHEGRPIRAIGTFQDVTARHVADEELSIAASVFENSLNGVVITDAETRIVKTNRAFTRILGYRAEEVIGRKTHSFNSRRHEPAFFAEMWATLARDGAWQGEIWDRRKDGEIIPLWQSITAVRDAEGRVKSYIGVFYDLSEQKRSAAHIHHLAFFDALTDLPNRQLFHDRCDQALMRAELGKRAVSLFFLDLDRFKYVNDTLGHRVGDELLCKVARRLTRALGRRDTVARLGGDEFIVMTQTARTRAQAERTAEKILGVFAKPFVVLGHRLDVRTSIGIAVHPENGADTDTLIKNADLAMYQAKEHGRGRFVFYESRFSAQMEERLFLERELGDAIRQDQLGLAFQPQFDLASGAMVGSEVLLRWRHPVRGPVSPALFIPIAEDTGQIVEIGEWVLRTACRIAADWRARGLGPHRIAVNLSGAQIERSDIVATVARILAETGLPAQALELEVTETYVMHKAQQSVRVLEGLRALGVDLAIDDFGTGHSSLAYLQRLPVDKLKIDRSFVTDLPYGENQAAITRAVVALGHSLHLKVLAEGVETPEQAQFLRDHGCDEVQGFLFGRPISAADLEARLRVAPSGPEVGDPALDGAIDALRLLVERAEPPAVPHVDAA